MFTDIEGSTLRWENHRAAMTDAIERHNALLERLIGEHRGYVFKRVGDAICAAFPTAADAVSAAYDAQRALVQEDFSAVGGLPVRMAIHAGDAEERGGDYLGPTVNRVARLLAIGNGGQILLSGAATDLVRSDIPVQTALRDLGSHRLKDLAHREQVYELVAPDLPQNFLPLRSLEAYPNNLPLQLTSFVGRESEIESVKELVQSHRLTTLVGAGGVGKTRLALHVAAELLQEYEDGIWLLELAPVSDGKLIVEQMASLFAVQPLGGRPLLDAVLLALRSKHMLLVVDNCEHVVDDAAAVLEQILHACPNIRVLATSREALKNEGEMVHRVASLGEEAGVTLFADRAKAALESFSVTEYNRTTVATICRNLDGIALAIELAAARARVLDVDELLAHLDERFRILTGGRRTALPRQQTMRALIDWSYDLLSEEERALLRRVSLFAGGWTLDAATAICADDRLQRWDVLDLLTSLVDKSLVVADIDESAHNMPKARYRLLESTRQYAGEKLTLTGEEDPLRRRHAKYFTELAQNAAQAWGKTATDAWLPPLTAETDNFRAALDWALLEKRDVETGAQLAGALFLFWRERAMMAEGLRYIDAALALEPALSERTVALLWLAKSFGAHTAALPRPLVRDASARAKELYEHLGDTFGAMCAQFHRADIETFLGEPNDARQDLIQAVAFFNDIGQPRWANYSLAALARNDMTLGDAESARSKFSEVLERARRQGDNRLINVSLNNLAECEFGSGNVDRAIELAREDIERDKKRHDLTGATYTLLNLAAYLITKKEYQEARTLADEGLRQAIEGGSVHLVACAINDLAPIAAHYGKFRDAALLLGHANTWFESQPREHTEQRIYELTMDMLREALDETQLAQALEAGAAASDDRVIAEALRI